MTKIETIVADFDPWKGKTTQIERLSGGLTNTNFKVTVDGKPFFVRIPGEGTELLAVDRQNEYHNALAAAESGVGPQIIHYLPEEHVMVLEFLVGATMSNGELNKPGMPDRIAQVIKRLHAGRRFLTDFDMFRLTDYYLTICGERAIRIPDGYAEREPTVRHIERAMAVKPLPTVPCHNDLLAENYMAVNGNLRLIDFEYSGNNDPCFELGNTCQELEYDDGQQEQVCAAYFGSAPAALVSRMKLNMIMSDVGWGLWAAIQARISTINFDFWGWATQRWDRAVEKMDSAEFPRWLKDVQN